MSRTGWGARQASQSLRRAGLCAQLSQVRLSHGRCRLRHGLVKPTCLPWGPRLLQEVAPPASRGSSVAVTCASIWWVSKGGPGPGRPTPIFQSFPRLTTPEPDTLKWGAGRRTRRAVICYNEPSGRFWCAPQLEKRSPKAAGLGGSVLPCCPYSASPASCLVASFLQNFSPQSPFWPPATCTPSKPIPNVTYS